jgi:hypothetical protein
VIKRLFAIAITLMLVGCASGEFHEKFDETQSLKGNSQIVKASAAAATGAAQVALVNQGFVIEQQSGSSITATRKTLDPDHPDTSFIVKASVVVTANSPKRADVSMAASKQTVLHKETKNWFSANEYQEVVRSEDTIDDPEFYSRFFAALEKQLNAMSEDQPKAASEDQSSDTPPAN